MSEALILIDFQNGLVSEDGCAATPLAGLVQEHGTLEAAQQALAAYREADRTVIHVHLAFDPTYSARTNRTERFDGHEEARRFQIGSYDADFRPEVAPRENEAVFAKGSVSAFASTGLLSALQARGIQSVALAGVATHLAIESTAREAADRGLDVTVLADACIAPATPHEHALTVSLPGFAAVKTVQEHLTAQQLAAGAPVEQLR